MAKPSPDWDLIKLRWAGVFLDGSPCEGSLELKYSGTVMLDDDPITPLSIFSRPLVLPITTTQVLIDGVQKTVGYAEILVPASNDPDIEGSGGTYSFTENLNGGGGRKNISFPVDKDAPNGEIWLPKVLPTNPTPGNLIPVVYYSDFNALKQRVTDIETNGGGTGGGGVTSYNDLTDKPVIPTKASDINAQPAGDYQPAGNYQPQGNYALSTDTRFTDARPPTAHNQAASTISDSTTVGRLVLTAADQAAARSAIGAGTSSLALGSNASQAKAGNWLPVISDVSGLRQELDDLAGSGYISGIINEGQTPPAPGIYIVRPV